MCLIGFAVNAVPGHPLVLAANRDEFHARPTAQAHWWADEPAIFGGRDELAGGTWLAVHSSGRLAAVTNVHEPSVARGGRSRGALVVDFLVSGASAERYAESVVATKSNYSPFNLLLFEDDAMHYVGSKGKKMPVPAGIHAVSNAPFGEEWPKTERMRSGLGAALRARDPVPALLELLAQRDGSRSPPDYRADLFIAGSEFGTRSSTIVMISQDGLLRFVERGFDSAGDTISEVREESRLIR